MSDRGDRGKRLSRRFEDEPDEEEDAQPSKSAKTSKTSKNDDETPRVDTGETGGEKDETADSDAENGEDDEPAVKERPSVLMYLPKEIRGDLDIRFDELNARHKREHGEGLEKNRDYYPAVVEAGLTGKDLEDILDL